MESKTKIYIAGHKGMVGKAVYNNLLSKGVEYDLKQIKI